VSIVAIAAGGLYTQRDRKRHHWLSQTSYHGRMKLALACAVLLAAVSVAHADDRELARKHFREGSQHYKLGEFNDALTSFKAAYRAFEDPSLLFNIAQCQRQLNLKQDAIHTYRAYLHDVPNAPERGEVQSTIAALEDALARERAAASSPPHGTLGTPPETGPSAPGEPNAAAPARADLVATGPTAARTPVYKKWWLWTIVGAVAAGGAVALGVALAPGPAAPSATTTNGTIHPF
jgi:tetratricopeptide (TPR) repeat protein